MSTARTRKKNNSDKNGAPRDAEKDAELQRRADDPAQRIAKHKREGPRETNAELDREFLYSMLMQRRFEERTAEMYAIGKIGGFCHLYIGQEAVSTGAIHQLREDDYVITAYREHTQAIAKGVDPNTVMAELYGRQDGVSGGKGGSMHLFSKEHNFLGGHGIVGGQIPLALGVAWKIKYREEQRVSQVYLGEGGGGAGQWTLREGNPVHKHSTAPGRPARRRA